jgi:hypothetical protein
MAFHPARKKFVKIYVICPHRLIFIVANVCAMQPRWIVSQQKQNSAGHRLSLIGTPMVG